MKTRFDFYFTILLAVIGLTITFGPLDIYAYSDKEHGDQESVDSSFSLPFDSAFADASHDGNGDGSDGDGDGSDGDGDDMDVDELPFP